MDVKTCKPCGATKPRGDFYPNITAANGGNVCRACKRKRDAGYRDKYRDSLRARATAIRRIEGPRYNEANRARSRRLREAVLAAYGGTCSCCGEARYEFLTLDHVGGGGSDHRRAIHRKVYAEVRRLGFPSGYRLLCWNCNCATGRYGYCPHERERAA